MKTNAMFGWTGRVLCVDLTHRRTRIERPDETFYQQHIGGKGLGGHYLHLCARLSWDHPQMMTGIFTGPLVATIAPTSGRAHLVSKSPLTGLVGDASVGGKLATRLKRAGWDGLVIRGRSDQPVGLEIIDERVFFRDARPFWGLDTETVFRQLNPGSASLAAIGPAAENGVRYAAICVDRHHAAGRTGLGLGWAVKGLKYVMVNGSERVAVRNPAGLKQAREDILRLTAASPALMGPYGFTCLGTGAVYDLIDNRRMMPTDNFKRTRFPQASRLNAAAYGRKYRPRKHGCRGCHILCKRIGEFEGRPTSLPEFETMSHFTALIESADTDLVVAANRLCARYGMDTISAAATLACRREITGRDDPPAAILKTLEDIAYGREEGTLLGQGSVAYARAMGQPACAMAVKGLELPAYDPRGAYGMALGYAVSTRGGCHLRAYPIGHEILRKPVATDRFSFSGKARIVKIAEDLNAVVDSLTACKFIFFAASLEEYARALTAVTGIPFDAQRLLQAGERIDYRERIINHANGFDGRQDDLPQRFFREPGSGGSGLDIPPIDRHRFLETRSKYFKIRGLDPQGRPTRETAQRLGIVCNDL